MPINEWCILPKRVGENRGFVSIPSVIGDKMTKKTKKNKKTNAVPHVLVVEDEPDHARFVEYVLNKNGYDVAVTSSVHAAVDLARHRDFDVILMDVMLPDGNGIDACEKIREDQRLKNVPIMMLTAKSDVKDKIKSFQAGADDYIVKPFQLEELLARVELMLRTKELRESEERYRDLVENLQDLVFMVSPSGVIRGVNRKTEESIGI